VARYRIGVAPSPICVAIGHRRSGITTALRRSAAATANLQRIPAGSKSRRALPNPAFETKSR
jgi:hypothetical protein